MLTVGNCRNKKEQKSVLDFWEGKGGMCIKLQVTVALDLPNRNAAACLLYNFQEKRCRIVTSRDLNFIIFRPMCIFKPPDLLLHSQLQPKDEFAICFQI